MSRANRGTAILATVVLAITGVVVAILVLAVAFVLFKGNPRNSLVHDLYQLANDLVGPFKDLFTPKDRQLRQILNYGIPALIYLVIGSIIARLLRRVP